MIGAIKRVSCMYGLILLIRTRLPTSTGTIQKPLVNPCRIPIKRPKAIRNTGQVKNQNGKTRTFKVFSSNKPPAIRMNIPAHTRPRLLRLSNCSHLPILRSILFLILSSNLFLNCSSFMHLNLSQSKQVFITDTREDR